MLITRTSILHYMARFGYFLCSVTAWKHVRTADHWHPGSVLTPNKKSALSATDYTFILSEAVVASAQRSKWWSMSICWHGYRRLGQRSSHIPSTLFFYKICVYCENYERDSTDRLSQRWPEVHHERRLAWTHRMQPSRVHVSCLSCSAVN